ncbi:MAG: PilT/PilU family type 4a pilus ATPase [Deltaproteobacteria bacterium]|jgi:twitching motility protein PilT|nr:PilT/PilU family type 4a pilus ATPase [Deltaproteobacteria bacterium]PNV86694.1 MAG: twitching motility protein [Desulfobacteraceae bacterium]MDH3774582.1 PilT/PilU family type 4a pilus ATPase [Deltaproteobacteria bacterium]MDH3800763.1 PilT/PilU family type 4a pilus ATPase [Deltaproteobacteria bacterium]MDH3849662.1 PilT/PilU family type 4a pilus ATPase [Deltaproteobacteria bacterium]
MRKREVDHFLRKMLDFHENVSDLIVTVDRPFQVESDGELMAVPMDVQLDNLTPFQTEIFALNLLGGDRRNVETLLSEGSCDLSYHLAGKARFRVNVFSQRGYFSVVMRKLETRIPSVEDLKLPEVFKQMAHERNGIIFVTGATGSGKSTSLASTLNEVNDLRPVHIVTLEDPVEFVHHHRKATFNQREMGTDFDTFASGLRASLRQAPKIILVGEMRDRETVEIGLSAAETGHLVLTTLHTVDAGQTINRILGMFDTEEEKQIRIRLSDAIRYVVCQRLLPREGGGRVAAFEIMGKDIRVKELILDGESEGKTFYEVIESNRAFGWRTFDDSILELFQEGQISHDTAMAYASKKAIMRRGIDRIKSARGEKVTDIDGLEVDRGYGTRDKAKK